MKNTSYLRLTLVPEHFGAKQPLISGNETFASTKLWDIISFVTRSAHHILPHSDLAYFRNHLVVINPFSSAFRVSVDFLLRLLCLAWPPGLSHSMISLINHHYLPNVIKRMWAGGLVCQSCFIIIVVHVYWDLMQAFVASVRCNQM